MSIHTQVKNPSLLSSLFSTSFVDKLVADKHIEHITGVFKQTGFITRIQEDATVNDSLKKAFDYLNKHYRCEYVFKTAVLNEVLLKRHDFDSVFLTEFRALNAKADIVILNGTSTVYEIKSDIDSLDRLPGQLAAYQKIFDKVFVVSNEKNKEGIRKIVGPKIGILILNPDLTISTEREARSNRATLNKAVMFDCLRKNEYLAIIEQAFGYVPKVPGTVIHSYCRKLFCSLSNRTAHSYFLNALKIRQLSGEQIKFVRKTNLHFRCILTEKIYSPKACELIKFGLSKKIFA